MTELLVSLALLLSQQHGLNSNHLLATIQCESGWNPTVPGDDGNSLGLAQISMKWHPEISPEQAKDPVFALQWMVSEWDAGHATRWSAYRHLLKKYGDGQWPLDDPALCK